MIGFNICPRSMWGKLCDLIRMIDGSLLFFSSPLFVGKRKLSDVWQFSIEKTSIPGKEMQSQEVVVERILILSQGIYCTLYLPMYIFVLGGFYCFDSRK